MPLTERIFGVLFYITEPISVTDLSKMLALSAEEVDRACGTLADELSERGVRLVRSGDTVQLATAPELSEVILRIQKDTLSRDIGKAGAETLAIILYQGTASRASIDGLRGVNSATILRSLMMRGLIERVRTEGDSRSFSYRVTPQLLEHLGVSDVSELTDFTEIMAALEEADIA